MGSQFLDSFNMLRITFVLTVLALAFTEASIGDEWAAYKLKWGKAYTRAEDTARFAIWNANREMVEAHNAGDHEWTMALVESSDWTQEEFEDRHLGYKPSHSDAPLKHFEPLPGAPSKVDFRDEGKVTGVKNQGQCGSCWAFSATGSLEGMWMKNHGELISMSEQQLVDCGQGSCQGGYMNYAWETARNGIESEATYPYVGRDGSCHYNSNNEVARCSGTGRVGHSESALEGAIAQVGYSISVAIHVGSSFQHYNGGVFSDPSCQNGQLNHGVLVVGYDKTSGTPHWIVKNSWSASWGSNGYILMKIGENSCGIANNPMYPV